MPSWTMALIKKARQLREGGLSLREVARELGRSPSQLRRHLSARGGPAPPAEELRERQGAAASARNRDSCRTLGWPEVVVPAHAKILEALRRLGPLSHADLALALGWTLCVGPRGGRRCRNLKRRLAQLTRPFTAQRDEYDDYSRGPREERRYVEMLPGWPPRYALAAWLAARKAEG